MSQLTAYIYLSIYRVCGVESKTINKSILVHISLKVTNRYTYRHTLVFFSTENDSTPLVCWTLELRHTTGLRVSSLEALYLSLCYTLRLCLPLCGLCCVLQFGKNQQENPAHFNLTFPYMQLYFVNYIFYKWVLILYYYFSFPGIFFTTSRTKGNTA